MTDLIHITSPERALNIISKGAYITDNNPGHYDAGMNFLGVLGEYPNTQPTRGAKVHLYVFFHDFRILKPYLLKKALEHLQEVNYKLTNEEVTISIKWGR